MKGCFGARVALHQARRALAWRLHPLPWADLRAAPAAFPFTLIEKSSPLQRAPDGAIAACIAEKTRNLQLACARIDGLLIPPGAVFSFCRTVGRSTRQKGYLPALEMHDGTLLPSVGGGLCQLANLLLLLALETNTEIIERHRHSYDLFRDVDRTVPFGCGATVFYNYIDFQFRNRLPFPICLQARVEPPLLLASLHAESPLPFQVTLRETDHRFYREGGHIYRTNRIWREVAWYDGRPAERELLFHNTCRVLYPADDLLEEPSHA